MISLLRFSDYDVVYLKPGDQINNAYQKMKLIEIWQIPIVGWISFA